MKIGRHEMHSTSLEFGGAGIYGGAKPSTFVIQPIPSRSSTLDVFNDTLSIA